MDAVSDVLQRTTVIQGDQGRLVTSTITSTATGLVATDAFTVSPIQAQIDLAKQCWRETIYQVMELGLFYPEAATATLTLILAQREYACPTDFEQVAGEDNDTRVIRGATNRWILYEYPGGYMKMMADQRVASDWQGTPMHWALSPANNATPQIRLDREPNSQTVGWTYNYMYQRRIDMRNATATSAMPFSDTAIDLLVPVVAEYWNRCRKGTMAPDILKSNLVAALSFVRQKPRSERWGPRRRFGVIDGGQRY